MDSIPKPQRSTKIAKEFADLHDIPRFRDARFVNANDFTEDEYAEYEKFSKERKKRKNKAHYANRVAQGKMPRKKTRADMTPEEIEKARKRTRGSKSDNTDKRRFLLHYASQELGLDVPNFNDIQLNPLRKLLRENGVSDETLKQLEQQALDEPIPPKTKKPKVEKTEKVKKMNHRVKIFLELEENKDHYHFERPCELRTQEEKNKFDNWWKKYQRKNNEEYRAKRKMAENTYDATRREQRSLAGKERRKVDPEGVRDNERKYRETPGGKLNRYFWDIKRLATDKHWPFEVNEEYIANMSKEPCYYCGDVDVGRIGVDAVVNEKGFVDGNLQSCCAFCNKAKKDHDWQDFVRIMCNIGTKHSDAGETWHPLYEFVNEKKAVNSVSYSQYKSSAKALKREFKITEEQFNEIVRQACFYCGIFKEGQNIGVDRIDSKQGYVLSNITPSCGACNLMKNDNNQLTFIDKAIKITKLWASKYHTIDNYKI